jgi:hypothetical protein
VLFTLAADTQQRIKTFRSERIAAIMVGQGPVPLPAEGRLIVHLVPLSAFGLATQIDLEKAYQALDQFRPIASTGPTPRFNLDGFIHVWEFGYTQVFRNGIVEATLAKILYKPGANVISRALDEPPPSGTICDAAIVGKIIEALPGYFEGLRALDVPPPIVLMVSYQGVAGARLAVRGYDPLAMDPFPSVDPLLLPEVIIDDYGSPESYSRELRPVFDALWNTTGRFARCTYYDVDGNWQSLH